MRSIKDMYSGTRVILLGLVGILSLLYMFNVYAHRNQHHNDWHVYSNTMNGYMSIINTSNHWHVCTIGVYQFELPPARLNQYGQVVPSESRRYPAGPWGCY